MTAESLLRSLVVSLRASDIPFMLTGSVASAYHGAGRATMDIDLVVDPLPTQFETFIGLVESSGMYVSADAAREALARRTMFSVVDPESGWKADVIVRKARSFSETEFGRRQPTEFMGVHIEVATLEDVILSKLEWAQLGGSARQLEDVRTLLRLRSEDLDRVYVETWVQALGLQDQWASVRVTHDS